MGGRIDHRREIFLPGARAGAIAAASGCVYNPRGASFRFLQTEERRDAASSQDSAKPLPDLRNGDSLSNH